MAIAWSRISSKVIAPPMRMKRTEDHVGTGEVVRTYLYRREVTKESRKHWKVRDAEGTPFSQMQEGMGHVPLGRPQPPKPHTEARSAPCPPPHDTAKHTRKPSNVAALKRRSALSGTDAKRNGPLMPSNALWRIWASPKIWWRRAKGVCGVKKSSWAKS